MRSPKLVILEWVKYINSHEAQKISELYHDDAINIQMAIGKPLNGKTEIFEDFTNFFQNIPNTFTKIENLFEDGEWAILEWSGGGTFKPTKKEFKLNGCGFFHIVNGKIKYQRGYWDKHAWYSQIGLLVE